jgi:hypothetical protein
MALRQDVLRQPSGQLLGILHRGFAKVEEGADLGAVVLYGASLPVMARELFWRNAGLYGNGGDGGWQHLLRREGEAAGVLNELCNTPKPSRVGPALLANRAAPAGSRVQCSASSKSVHSRFMRSIAPAQEG